jgi:hypothetical protein
MKSEKGTNVVSLLSIEGKIPYHTMLIIPDYQTLYKFWKLQNMYIYTEQRQMTTIQVCLTFRGSCVIEKLGETKL